MATTNKQLRIRNTDGTYEYISQHTQINSFRAGISLASLPQQAKTYTLMKPQQNPSPFTIKEHLRSQNTYTPEVQKPRHQDSKNYLTPTTVPIHSFNSNQHARNVSNNPSFQLVPGQSTSFKTIYQPAQRPQFAQRNPASLISGQSVQTNNVSASNNIYTTDHRFASPMEIGVNHRVLQNYYPENNKHSTSPQKKFDNNNYSTVSTQPVSAIQTMAENPKQPPKAAESSTYQFYNQTNYTTGTQNKEKTINNNKQFQQTNGWKKPVNQSQQKVNSPFLKNTDAQLKFKEVEYKTKNQKQSILEWEKKYNKLFEEYQSLQKQSKTIKLNSNSNNSITYYLQQNLEKQTRLREFQIEKKTLTQQVASLKNRQKLYLQDIDKYKTQKMVPSAQVQQLNKRIADLTNQIRQLKYQNSKYKDVQKVNNQLKEHVSNYTNKISNLQAQLQAEIANCKGLQLQIRNYRNQLQKENEQANIKISSLKDNLNFRQKSFKSLQQQNHRLKTEALTNQQKIRDLESKSGKSTRELELAKNQLQNHKNSLSTNISNLESQVSKLQAQLSLTKLDYNKLLADKHSASQNTHQNRQWQQQIQKLNKRIQEETSRLASAQAEINHLRTQLKTLQQINTKLSSQNQEQNANKATYNQLTLQIQDMHRFIQRQHSIYVAQEQHWTKLLAQKDQALKQKQTDIYALQKKLHQNNSKHLASIQKLHTDWAIQKSQAEAQRITSTPHPQIQQQYNQLEKEFGQVKQQLNVKQAQFAKLIEQLEKTQDQKITQVGFLNIEIINKQAIIKDLQNSQASHFKDLQIGYQNLAQQNSILSKNYNDQVMNCRRLTQEIQSFKMQKNTQVNNLQSQIRNRELTIEQLRNANSGAAEHKHNLLLDEYTKLKSKLTQKEQYFQEIQLGFKKNQSDYQDLRKEYAKLQIRTAELEKDNGILNQKYSLLLSQKSKAVSYQNTQANEQSIKLKLQNGGLQRKMRSLEQSLTAETQRFKSQNNKALYLSNQLSELKQKYEQAQRRYKQIQIQSKTAQQKNNRYERELKEIQAKYTADLEKQRSEQIMRARQQINRYKQINQETTNDYQTLFNNRFQLQNEYEQLRDRYNALQNQYRSINSNNSSSNQEINRLMVQNSKLARQSEKLDKDLKVQKSSYQQLNQKYIQISLESSALKSKNNQLQANLRELQTLRFRNSQLQTKLREVQSVRQRNSQMQGKLRDGIKQRNTALQIQLKQHKLKLLQIQQTNRDLQSTALNLQTKTRQITILREQKSKLQDEIYRLKSNNAQLEQRTRQIQPVVSGGDDYRYLFHGDILRDEDQHKLFIKESIQKHQKIRIIDTRLIYRYDPFNKENIHKYIDQKPQLVVVIKLINGYFLAGYAQGFFKPRTPSDKQGLIMSLTNKKCYYLVQRNKRSISYDDFFVIFGNSEIRIKSQEKKMFSNFGVSSSYYRHNGDGVNALLGGTKTEREIELVGYEFYQLILK